MTIAVEIETRIGRPTADVFAALTDVERYPEWLIASGIVRVERLDPGPLAAGSRLRIAQTVAGRSTTLDGLVTIHAPVASKAKKVKVTDQMLEVCETVRPKLLRDGMFLVGLDIVGDKLMEINVFSPGGLGSCQHLYEVDFPAAVIEALEQKVALREHYGSTVDNARLATV